jgi:hypothetical protein
MANDQVEANVVGKWLVKEENSSSGDNSGEEEVEVTSDMGGSNPESGNSNSGSGNGNPRSGNCNSNGKEDRRERRLVKSKLRWWY